MQCFYSHFDFSTLLIFLYYSALFLYNFILVILWIYSNIILTFFSKYDFILKLLWLYSCMFSPYSHFLTTLSYYDFTLFQLYSQNYYFILIILTLFS